MSATNLTHEQRVQFEKAEEQRSLAPVSGSAVDTARFVIMSRLQDAHMDGYEHGRDVRLPKIPERWDRPDLRDAWITGYVQEIRNRLESPNDALCREAGQKDVK